MKPRASAVFAMVLIALAGGCRDDSSVPSPGDSATTAGGRSVGGGSTGVDATGGAALGGAATGGDATGGGAFRGTMGSAGTGSAGTGGAAMGGSSPGGQASDGGSPGGAATGSAGNGGAATGGTRGGSAPAGGTGTGGAPVGGRSGGGAAADGGADTGGIGAGGATGGGLDTGGATAGGAETGGESHAGPWRITPFGDSITGTTCYPKLLSKLLIDEGRTQFEFVGSQLNNQDCGSGVPNVQTEGHGGYLVTQLVPGGAHADELPIWCSTNQSEIVLFHYGTNDTWNSTLSTPTILDAFSVVIGALRDANPAVIVLVAQIIPNAACSTCETSIPELNAAIVDWAAATTTAASPIYAVDQFTGFEPATDTGDGCHPNLQGSEKMARRWADALAAHGLL